MPKSQGASFKERAMQYGRTHKVLLAILLSIISLGGMYLLELCVINGRVFSRDILLDNADSLVLPLLKKSLLAREAFEWKFSSQLFIFPEGLLFTLSSLFLATKSALLVNGFLNLLTAWAFIYLIINQLRKRNYWLHPLLATLCCGVVLGLMALEQQPASLLLTPFLTTTYYAGVVLAVLFSIWAALWVARDLSQHKALHKRAVIMYCLVGLAAALTALSNPLFIIWFTLPFALVVATGFLINIYRFRTVVVLLVPQLAGAFAGMLLRIPLKQYIGASLGGYFNPERIATSITNTQDRFTALWGIRFQQFEYGFVLLVGLSLLVGLLFSIKRYTTRPASQQTLGAQQRFLLFGLGVAIPVVATSLTLLSGNDILRYFLPVFIMPVFCAIIFVSYNRVYWWVVRSRFFVLGTLMFVSLIVPVTLPTVHNMARNYPIGAQCLDSQLQPRVQNYGVASFWRARSLELDSRTSKTITQVAPDLSVYPWMNNTASYSHDFTFVVVDTTTHSLQDVQGATVVGSAGAPQQIAHCPEFDLYIYEPRSPEAQRLNQAIQQSLQNYKSQN